MPAALPKKKLPRYTPTDEDERILEAHFDYENLLTPRQVARLTGISIWRAEVRLRYLFQHDYLTRMDYPHRLLLPEAISIPTQKAALCVAWRRLVELTEVPFRTPRFSQIPHDIIVNDVHISMALAAKNNSDFSITSWKTAHWFSIQRKDPLLKATYALDGRQFTKRFEPDGAFCISYKDKVYKRLFIEIDMSTQPQTRLAREKIKTFLAYVGSEGYKVRFGSSYGHCLFVTVSELRARNLARMIEKTVGERAREFFITTQEALTEDTVFTAPIWRRCGTPDKKVALFREFEGQDDEEIVQPIIPPTQQSLFNFSQSVSPSG